MKLGELFIKIAVDFAVNNGIDEIYLTCFEEADDIVFLIRLIENYGFKKVSEKHNESVFTKRLLPDMNVEKPIDIALNFYPSFYDGELVEKYIVPIQPEYYKKLIIDNEPKQLALKGIGDQVVIERNTIKKAYLCHAKINRINEGDLLLFYRSSDYRALTAIGVVERFFSTKDPNEIIRIVGKRTVYSHNEIIQMAMSQTKVIMFLFHFLLEEIELKRLKELVILKGPPQSIMRIGHEEYLKIKEIGKINERFTFDKTKIC